MLFRNRLLVNRRFLPSNGAGGSWPWGTQGASRLLTPWRLLGSNLPHAGFWTVSEALKPSGTRFIFQEADFCDYVPIFDHPTRVVRSLRTDER